jgi:hypothetical protein
MEVSRPIEYAVRSYTEAVFVGDVEVGVIDVVKCMDEGSLGVRRGTFDACASSCIME